MWNCAVFFFALAFQTLKRWKKDQKVYSKNFLFTIIVCLFFTVLGQHTSKSNRREISQNSKIQQSLSRTSGLTRGHRYVFRGLWVQNTIPRRRRFLGLFFTNWLRDHSNGKVFLWNQFCQLKVQHSETRHIWPFVGRAKICFKTFCLNPWDFLPKIVNTFWIHHIRGQKCLVSSYKVIAFQPLFLVKRSLGWSWANSSRAWSKPQSFATEPGQEDCCVTTWFLCPKSRRIKKGATIEVSKIF